MYIEEVQRRLWEESKTHKANRGSSRPLFPVNPYDMRIRKLMDLMHNQTWLREAAERVLARSRGKKPGVDEVSVNEFRKNLEDNIETLRLELKHGTYQPKPVRQVLIPKADGKMRALGIPCLRDKIVQEAIRMALEPIFEVEFHDNSYGFRPNRNAHHAISRSRSLMQTGYKWVIEGDVKACFDEISHKAILKVVREKVMDNKFLNLIERFLKAGVSIKDVVHPTVKGVPQGGVISPLLANAVLNKLDWFLQEKGVYERKAAERNWYHGQPNVRFVRYADDWCVFITRGSKRYAERLREEIARFLHKECSLELSVDKTHITHVRDGFSFLGFLLRCGIGKSGKIVPKIKVGQKGIQNFKRRIYDATRNVAHHISIAARIHRASQVVRGWGEYFRIAHNYSSVANKLDYYVHAVMRSTICRRMDIHTAKCYREYYANGTFHYKREEVLARLSHKTTEIYYRKPKPYEPGIKSFNESDSELEVVVINRGANKRRGSWDLKLDQIARDQYRCRACRNGVKVKTSHLHHVKPVSTFPNYEAANIESNLQTLCLECHKEKHASKRAKRNDT
jgi:group II intron reverse transcriptase/maturase